MSASGSASVYVTDDFSEPMSAQHNFVNNFDLDHPEEAMSAYQRYVTLQRLTQRFRPNIIPGSCTSTQSASLALPPALLADEQA